jgi:hypothetical protein
MSSPWVVPVAGGEGVVLQKILDFVVVGALPNRLYRLGSDR